MTEIRRATLDDLPAIMPLARMMHAESPRYSRLTWSEEKARATLAGMIDMRWACCYVAERERRIVGGVIGACMEHWFSTERYASDFAAFVEPLARGSMIGARLIDTYTAWAREQGARIIEFGVLAGINVEQTTKLLQRRGYAVCGLVLEVDACARG